MIMSCESIPGLMEAVNQARAGGWEVTGGMAVEKYSTHVTWYHQAMLRPVEEGKPIPCPSCGAMAVHTPDCIHDGNG